MMVLTSCGVRFCASSTMKNTRDKLLPRIGHKGSRLKAVGIGARKQLEAFFAKKVHVETFVKVKKNWRDNDLQLKRFGYKN